MSRLGLQLTPCATSAQPTSPALARAAELGFGGVEFHDPRHAPAEVRGCSTVTASRRAHATRGSRRSRRSAGLARELEALGTNRLVVAWISPPRTAREADAVAARLVAAAERVAPLGVRLGFHNHDGELALLDDGSRMLDRLLVEDAPLFLELDLGWAWYAGVDPFELVERAGGRVPIVHVKDLRRAGGPMHVPLGDGEIDYEALGASAAAAGGSGSWSSRTRPTVMGSRRSLDPAHLPPPARTRPPAWSSSAAASSATRTRRTPRRSTAFSIVVRADRDEERSAAPAAEHGLDAVEVEALLSDAQVDVVLNLTPWRPTRPSRTPPSRRGSTSTRRSRQR